MTLLSPLVGNSPSSVVNSADFATFVRDQHLSKGEVLVSFDVVALFTNVPVDLACRVTRNRLLMDPTLMDHTSLSVDQVMTLLEFCLNATYLSFRSVRYQQVFGTAMGLPMSVIIANLVMEDVESRALSSFIPPPCFWKHYIDDTCCTLMVSDILRFLCHLNSVERSIQFTSEQEEMAFCPSWTYG